MNPRATANDSAKTDIRTSPFEQITQLENEQEARVVQAAEEFATEERDAAKAMQSAEKLNEEKLRDEARQELKDFSQKEPAAILTKSEEETAADLKEISRQFEKASPKAQKALIDSVLNGSVLSA